MSVNYANSAGSVAAFPTAATTNGYVSLPGGVIIQWGRHFYGDAKGGRTPALPFNFNFTEVFVVTHANFGTGYAVPTFYNLTVGGCSVEMDEWYSHGQSTTVHWIAIGR
jgi:hypothetical protein